MRIVEDVKMIWQYLKKYRKRVYLVMGVALVGSAITAAIPYIQGRIVDLVISEGIALVWIVGILGVWLTLRVISSLIKRWTEKEGNIISIKAGNDLFEKLMDRLWELPMSFHKEKRIGDISQRISRAIDYLEAIISNIVFEMLPVLFSVVAALVIMAWIEWKLALLLVVILVICGLISVRKTEIAIREIKGLMKAHDKTHGDALDSVENIQAVKSNVMENYEKRKIRKDLEEVEKGFKSFINPSISTTFWQENILTVGFVLIFGLAIVFLKANIISVGEIVMLVGYVFLTYQPFEGLIFNYRMFRRGIAAMERALLILEEEPEKYSGTIELKDVQGKVKFQDVSFGYNSDGKATLKKINFKVEPGQVIALVGESGGGKTTLIDLILRYYSPDEGKILIDNRDIQEVNLKSLRENIAVVPQETTMFNESIKYNISYGKPNATNEEIIEAAKAANADEFIQEFPEKYNQLVGERGIKLSGGQRQRIAIARAILRDPKIFILDEATSSVDTISEKLIQESLEKLIKGRTTFIIAHRLSTVVNADKILVLEKGKIVEQGTHNELIQKKGNYWRLASLQLRLGE